MKSFLLNEYWSTHKVQPNEKPETEIMEDRNLNEQRFKNIFEARAIKCEYLVEGLKNTAKHSHFVNYTNWLTDTKAETKKICDKFDINFNGEKELPGQRETRFFNIDPEIKKIIDDNLDWETENKMGFSQRAD